VLSYQWYSSTYASNASGSAIAGATEAFYATPPLSASGTYYYYCVITNTNNNSLGEKVATVKSSVATVTVRAAGSSTDAQTPEILTQPAADTSIVAGETVTLTVSARVSDGGALSYRWYSSMASGNSGSSSSGNYTTPVFSAAGTYFFYCIVTNTNSAATGANVAMIGSSVAMVTVVPRVDAQTPSFGPSGQPAASTTISPGGTASLSVSVSVTDGGALTYQWYSNAQASNAGGAAISGATAASYTTPVLSAAGSYYYYCVITNTNNAVNGEKAATVGSNVAKVTVLVNAQTPVIGTQPAANTAISSGGTATLTVSATVSDGGTLSYQWYSNNAASGENGSNISSATSASYATPALSTGSYYYYCVITNTNSGASGNKVATITTNVATVTASLPDNAQMPTIITQPAANTTISTGTAATLTVAASVTDGGTLFYQWYQNTSASSTGGSSISGAMSATYTTPSLGNGAYWYYCEVTNHNGNAAVNVDATLASAVAAVTVNALVNAVTPVIGTQPAGGSFVVNYAFPPTLTVSATVSDGGTLSYQWYSNTAASSTGGTLIGAATSASYAAPVNTVGTRYYYCLVKNTITDNGDGGNKTASIESGVATVIIKAQTLPPNISGQPSGQTISAGATATLSVTATSPDGGTLTYQWYSTSKTFPDGTATAISGATGASYTTGTLSAGTYNYYCDIKNSDGVSTDTLSSNVITVTVNAGSPTVGIEWTAVTTSAFGTTQINGIAYGGPSGSEKFVAVGYNGKMAYSSDGVNWTAIPEGTGSGTSTFGTEWIGGIAWGGPSVSQKFVAVGYNGKMAYSADGVNWTAIPNGTGAGTSTFYTNDILGIAWGGPSGNQKFVAVGGSGQMAYSSDGVNWTAISTSTFGTDHIYGITWGGPSGNEKFVAVGKNGKMAYSSDGVNWTAISISTFDVGIERIAWGGPSGSQKFVAVGGLGMMAYSSDGVNWTAIPGGTGTGTSTFGSESIYGIAWGGTGLNEKFVAGAYNGKMAYSADGVNWTAIPPGTGAGTSTFGTSDINAIAYGNGKFVAVGSYGKIAVSQ
jgi:hypothetical protein